LDKKTPLIIITGPTGSGKTALALEMAHSYPIEVISADSMQIYRFMDIATAKPSRDEQSALPHHLIDIINPDEEFNAGMFSALAAQRISGLYERKRIPLVVGGTGLYIKSLVYGLIQVPPKSDKLRDYFSALKRKRGLEYVWSVLERLDPASAEKVSRNDSVRILRYLEIIFITGVRPSSLHKRHGFAEPAYHVQTVCIMPDRQDLYGSIDKRVYAMMDQGLVEETQGLLERGYSPVLRSMQTLAYKHITGYLDSQLSLDQALSLIQRDTRHYAKRQITWIRSHHSQERYHTFEECTSIMPRLLDRVYDMPRIPC